MPELVCRRLLVEFFESVLLHRRQDPTLEQMPSALVARSALLEASGEARQFELFAPIPVKEAVRGRQEDFAHEVTVCKWASGTILG